MAAAVALSAAAAPAAQARLAVGVGDQKPETFSDPRFRALGVQHTRYITPWNSIIEDPHGLERWISAARAAGLRPLIAFGHASGDRCPRSPCRLPSIGQYRRAVDRFRKRYPWIRTFQPWNEANHQSQPTARNPKRAAQYYNAMRRLCRGCRIVAADVLDSSNMERWLRRFMRYAKRPRTWGLHNYADANRFRRSGVERILDTVPGQVWLTETGGIVSFRTHDGRVVFRKSSRRAAKATRHLFRLAARHPRRIKRLYLYHWAGDSSNRFDSGLIDSRGRPRPAFYVVRNELRRLGVGLPG
ncbi:MAG: glycosyl hydrolase [Thermoleophilaceae bacterium]